MQTDIAGAVIKKDLIDVAHPELGGNVKLISVDGRGNESEFHCTPDEFKAIKNGQLLRVKLAPTIYVLKDADDMEGKKLKIGGTGAKKQSSPKLTEEQKKLVPTVGSKILALLKKGPMGASDIRDPLEKENPLCDKTLIKECLNELLESKKVGKTGQKAGTKYTLAHVAQK